MQIPPCVVDPTKFSWPGLMTGRGMPPIGLEHLPAFSLRHRRFCCRINQVFSTWNKYAERHSFSVDTHMVVRSTFRYWVPRHGLEQRILNMRVDCFELAIRNSTFRVVRE